ncbi:hypothetical protein [Photobacterium leiognathi]|nr:hypothetical protein [Photobacterium leiognathi]
MSFERRPTRELVQIAAAGKVALPYRTNHLKHIRSVGQAQATLYK